MATSKEFNTDIDVKGMIKATSVPNRTGVPMIYDASTNTFSHRTASQFISDYNLEVKGHTHSWGQITGKPTTFNPSSHTHPISEIDGLQWELNGKLNNTQGGAVSNINDPGRMDVSILQISNSTTEGSPFGTHNGTLYTFGGHGGFQIVTSDNANGSYKIRKYKNWNGTGDFFDLYHSGNLTKLSQLENDINFDDKYASINRTITAGTGLTGGGSLAGNRTINFDTTWGDNRYAGKSHTHPISQITNLQSTLNNKANTSDLPTKVSELENDSNYIDKTSDEIITGTKSFHQLRASSIGDILIPSDTSGWYRIARIYRGSGEIILSTTGGSWTPATYSIKYFRSWSGAIEFRTEKKGITNYVQQVRGCEDENGSNYHFIEVYLISGTNGLKLSLYHTQLDGYYSTNNEIYTGQVELSPEESEYYNETTIPINEMGLNIGRSYILNNEIYHKGNLTNLSQLNNDSGFLTTESDTLNSVANRGSVTNHSITVGGIFDRSTRFGATGPQGRSFTRDYFPTDGSKGAQAWIDVPLGARMFMYNVDMHANYNPPPSTNGGIFEKIGHADNSSNIPWVGVLWPISNYHQDVFIGQGRANDLPTWTKMWTDGNLNPVTLDTTQTISGNKNFTGNLQKDGVDVAKINGTYSGLRAQATTKADVGLSKVPNLDFRDYGLGTTTPTTSQIDNLVDNQFFSASPTDTSVPQYGSGFTASRSPDRSSQFLITNLGSVDSVRAFIRQKVNTWGVWRELWHDGNSDSFNASGNYASLRARGTTKADVGLSNVPNWSGSTSTSLGTSNNTIPSQGAVKSYVDSGLSGKANTSGTYSGLRAQATTKADVGLGNVDNYSRSHYDGRYASISRTISAGTGLTGGGSLSSNRTISIDSSTMSKINNGNTAYGLRNNYYDIVSNTGYVRMSGADANGMQAGERGLLQSGVANAPASGFNDIVTISQYGSDDLLQIVYPFRNDNKFYLRNKTGSGWGDWIKVYHSGNLNPVTINTTQTITGTKTFTKQVTAPDFTATSDARLKENITDHVPVKLKTTYKNFNFIGNNQDRVGVLAQELEKHHPEFVRTNQEGEKSVSYIDLHSAEIAYLKSQNEAKDKKIASLEERIAKLEKLLL